MLKPEVLWNFCCRFVCVTDFWLNFILDISFPIHIYICTVLIFVCLPATHVNMCVFATYMLVGLLEWFACLIFRGPLRWFQSAWEHQLCGKRLALWSLQFHYGKYAKYELDNTKMQNTNKQKPKMQNTKKLCWETLALQSLHLSNSIIAPHLYLIDGKREILMIESAFRSWKLPF